MAQLGGHGAFIDSQTTQISHGDTAKEIGEIFGRYFDGIAIRQVDWNFGNQYMNEVAKYSRSPVFNMQCEIYHPFQCLADLMTIMEKKGRDLRRKKIVVSWAYAASYLKPISVPQSLILQMPRFGMDDPGLSTRVQVDARHCGTGAGTGAHLWHLLRDSRQQGRHD
jgi:N-acetylornithine carbamoyltransferase